MHWVCIVKEPAHLTVLIGFQTITPHFINKWRAYQKPKTSVNEYAACRTTVLSGLKEFSIVFLFIHLFSKRVKYQAVLLSFTNQSQYSEKRLLLLPCSADDELMPGGLCLYHRPPNSSAASAPFYLHEETVGCCC